MAKSPTYNFSKITELSQIVNAFEGGDVNLLKAIRQLEKYSKDPTAKLDEEQKRVLSLIQTYKSYTEVVTTLTKTGYGGLADELKNVTEAEKERKNQLSELKKLINESKDAETERRKEILNIAQAYAKASGRSTEFSKILKKEKNAAVTEIKSGISDIFRSVTGFGRDIFNIGRGVFEPWGKADQAAANFAKSLGMSGAQMQSLRHNTIAFARDAHIGINYNKSIEELIALQKSYADQTGRNILLTNNQKESIAAMSAVMGDEAASALAGKLENFGIGLEKAGEMAGKMFNEANEHGISFEKYTKTVTDNLTLVQRYGFKNGIQGLTAMARKANEMKLDMQQVANFAEKVNTVEGAISTAANLQVLGGPFATIGSDPMSMLYEGLNDMEGLQDRIIKMFGSLGRLNKETGQVETSNFDKFRVREAAKSMGLDQNEVFQMINRSAVRNEIQQQVRGREDVDDKVLNYLSNIATFNSKGEAIVDIGNGEQKISELNFRDKKTLDKLTAINNNEAQDIKSIAMTLRGWDDVMTGVRKQYDINKADVVEGKDGGLGNTVKGIAIGIGESNGLLKSIFWAITAGQGINAILNLGSGLVKGWKSLAGGLKNFKAFSVKEPKVPQTLTTRNNAVYKRVGETIYGRNKTGRAINMLTGKPVLRENLPADVEKQFKQLKGSPTPANPRPSRVGGTLTKITKFLGKTGGKMVAGGAMAGAIEGISHAVSGDFKKAYTKEQRENKTKAIGETAGATVGGAVGSLLGPVGAIAGSFIGKFIGGLGGQAVNSIVSKRRLKAKREIVESLGGVNTERGKAISRLSGDYSKEELERIARAYSKGQIKAGSLSDELLEKMARSGDIGKLKGLEEVFRNSSVAGKVDVDNQEATIAQGTYTVENAVFNTKNGSYEVQKAGGGILEGPSHSEGGMPIIGSPITVEGGEYIVNKESTKLYKPVLDVINTMPGGLSQSQFAQAPKVEAPATGVKPLAVAPASLAPVNHSLSQFAQAPKVEAPATGVKQTAATPVNQIENIETKYSLADQFLIDKFRVREAAKSMGLDPSEVFRMVNHSAVRVDTNGNTLSQPIQISKSDSPTAGIKPMAVTPGTPGGGSSQNSIGGPQKIEIPPIKIKFEGSIRLDGTNQNLDLNQLMNNKDFVTQFSQMISRQIEDNLQGGYFKDTRKNKFPTF